METINATGEKQAAKKRTTVMTNSFNQAEVLMQAQRKGLHTHQHLVGTRQRVPGVPPSFVDSIAEAIKKKICDAQWRLVALDVARAYLYLPASRPLFNRIPAEDRLESEFGKVAQLNLSVYGTKDAVKQWTATYTEFLNSLGFKTGVGCPCNFAHRTREISLTVHGEDFMSMAIASVSCSSPPFPGGVLARHSKIAGERT